MSKMKKELMKEYQRDYRVTHTQLAVTLPAELVVSFKMQLKRDNLSCTAFIKSAIQAYLGESEDTGDNKNGKKL